MQHNFSNIAGRIKYIRLLSKLSRAKINSELNISSNTLFSWESGKSIPNSCSLEAFVNAFRSIGIICSTEWIKSGGGTVPYKIDSLLTPSELHYLDVLSKQATFISYVNRDEKFLFVNEKYGEIFNAPPSEIIGKKLRDLIGEQGYMICKPYINKVLSGEEVVFEYPWQFNPGAFRYLKIRYIPDLDNNKQVSGFYSFIDDTPIVLDPNNHAIFSSTPNIEDAIPDIMNISVAELIYDHKLYIEALEIVLKLFSQYNVIYNYEIITQVAKNVYIQAIQSNNQIKLTYADSIIKIALAAGKLMCK